MYQSYLPYSFSFYFWLRFEKRKNYTDHCPRSISLWIISESDACPALLSPTSCDCNPPHRAISALCCPVEGATDPARPSTGLIPHLIIHAVTSCCFALVRVPAGHSGWLQAISECLSVWPLCALIRCEHVQRSICLSLMSHGPSS